MNWPNVVSRRADGSYQVDARATATALGVGAALFALVRWLFSGAAYVIVLAIVVIGGIAIDVRLRRRTGSNSDDGDL